jgi:hypothetical protein
MRSIVLAAACAAALEAAVAQTPEALFDARTPLEAQRALQAGASPRAYSSAAGRTSALHHAVRADRFGVAQVLLLSGADPNDNNDESTILNSAIATGDPALVRLLIAAGADVNAGDGAGAPLVHAARNGRGDIARLVMEAGADPNARFEGRTAAEIGGAAVARAIREALAGGIPRVRRIPADLAGRDEQELTRIGLEHHGRGDYTRSLDLFAYSALAAPTQPRGHFNQACALTLLGRHDEAIAALAHAVVLGADWVSGNLDDGDLNGLRDVPAFQLCVLAASPPLQESRWRGAQGADNLPDWVPGEQRAAESYGIRFGINETLEISIYTGPTKRGVYELRQGRLFWKLATSQSDASGRSLRTPIAEQGAALFGFVAPGILRVRNERGTLVPDGYYAEQR